jgi:hypothetical protein
VMKSAEDRSRHDLAELLDRSRQRRILGQSQMWPDIVVVSGIRRKNATQVILAQDHDVIEALPDGSSRSAAPHVRSAKWVLDLRVLDGWPLPGARGPLHCGISARLMSARGLGRVKTL